MYSVCGKQTLLQEGKRLAKGVPGGKEAGKLSSQSLPWLISLHFSPFHSEAFHKSSHPLQQHI